MAQNLNKEWRSVEVLSDSNETTIGGNYCLKRNCIFMSERKRDFICIFNKLYPIYR